MACGVRILDPEPGTELFEDIDLSGSRTVNSELTLTLTLTQAYPVAVRVGCYYEIADKELTEAEKRLGFHERASPIGETVLRPAGPGSRPDDEVAPMDLTFNFSVPAPGKYFVACLTPAAAENGIGMTFTVRGS
jgi:hypothetical protein